MRLNSVKTFEIHVSTMSISIVQNKTGYLTPLPNTPSFVLVSTTSLTTKSTNIFFITLDVDVRKNYIDNIGKKLI